MTRCELIDFCLTLPGAYEDYPFDEEWAVIRHSVNRKGFDFIYERVGRSCAILKCDPFEVDFLRQLYRDVTPAYHMKKAHWNTIAFGGDVPEDELRHMVERSYDLLKQKLKHGRLFY